MKSQTTLFSSIPERSVRDSYLGALLIVGISIKWLSSIVFVSVFVVIFVSFSVIQSYRSMSMKYFFECQIAVNVLIIFPTKFVFVVIFLSFSVIPSYRNMSMKCFFECQIAVNVLINFSHQIRTYLFWQ